jgi:hypothetical protein
MLMSSSSGQVQNRGKPRNGAGGGFSP